MGQDLVYLVEGPVATPAKRISLADSGLKERADLQEWVVAHPEVLGDGIRIVTIEYDKWSTGAGALARQRLDVLGLDHAGQLVVAELKRDQERDIHVQAVTYAALVSRFTVDTLAAVHADFLTRRGRATTTAEAESLLRDHVEGELDPQVLGNPRIVLLAADHPPQVDTTVDWLCEVSANRLKIETTHRQRVAHRRPLDVAVDHWDGNLHRWRPRPRYAATSLRKYSPGCCATMVMNC